jgi:3-deoxy-D-manno-octulosonate 8-phosphate phosphatase (KDO 8-P phosphatase)
MIMKDLLEKAAQIRLLIFDVDGVLTDGSLFLGDDGQEYKAFHSRDGHGIKMLLSQGVEVAIITGRTSEVVKHRMENLGVPHVPGPARQDPGLPPAARGTAAQRPQVAYVGDDVVDLPVMRQVGLAIAVQDAHPLVKQHAHWQTPSGGGRGAARDVCELIMQAQGTLESQLGTYLR